MPPSTDNCILEQLIACFRQSDTDNSGRVPRSQVIGFLESVGLKGDDVCSALPASSDVAYEEWLRWVLSEPGNCGTAVAAQAGGADGDCHPGVREAQRRAAMEHVRQAVKQARGRGIDDAQLCSALSELFQGEKARLEFSKQLHDELARGGHFPFPSEQRQGTGACETCACGESAKSSDLEDAGPPQYDDFFYQPLFESANPVQVPWTRLPELEKGVSASSLTGPGGAARSLVVVEPWVLRRLAERAISDVEHYLRPGHLAQLAKIMQDPEASDNDRFTAHNLLQNAVIAAKGVLPGCQDTGTAICMGKKGQFVWTDEEDERHLSHGIYDAYTKRNLRYSQVAPVSMFAEKNTQCNLPAQLELYTTKGSEYKFMFMAKGGGSANKTYLFQQTKALLNPKSLEAFIAEKVVTLGTSACPPYHLAIVIGGLSAEHCLKTVKLASARYLDDLPTSGNDHGRAYRDTKWEEKVLSMCQSLGIGAQFGGKYFVHDVRVVRMPRHGASCPVGIGVSCSADRQVLAKITEHGVFIEELERNPGRFLEGTGVSVGLGGAAVSVDLNQPMKDVLALLSKHPIKTRLSLTGTIIVARDIAHAKLAERLEKEGSLPGYMRDHVVYYAGPAKTPEGYASGSFGPTTAGRMDTYVPLFQKHGYSMVTLAKGNRARGVTESCKTHGGFYLGSIGGAAANLAEHSIKKVELVEYEELGMEAVWRIEVVDFPAFTIVDDKGNDFFSGWKM